MAFFKKEKKKINGKWYPQSVTVGKPVTTDEVAKRLTADTYSKDFRHTVLRYIRNKTITMNRVQEQCNFDFFNSYHTRRPDDYIPLIPVDEQIISLNYSFFIPKRKLPFGVNIPLKE